MRAPIATLVVALTIILSAVASAHWEDEPAGPPTPARDATAELHAVLDAAAPDLVACAFLSGRPDPARAGLQFVVSLDARARLRTRVVEPELARGPAASCLTRVVRRAVGRARPRLVGPAEATLTPFAALPQLTPAPASPVLIAPVEARALFDALRAAPDDAARLARLASEVANGRVLRPDAYVFVGAFRVRKVEAALTMCGMLLREDARAQLATVVPPAQRAYFLAVTEGGCGVPMPADRVLPIAPPPAECTVHADCVLIPRAPPSCCGNSCRGGVSVPRAAAAAMTAQCEGQRPDRCSPMACAYEPSVAVCVSGRCSSASARGQLDRVGPGF